MGEVECLTHPIHATEGERGTGLLGTGIQTFEERNCVIGSSDLQTGWVNKVPLVAYVRCSDFKIEYDSDGKPLYAWVSPEEVANKMGYAVDKKNIDPCT